MATARRAFTILAIGCLVLLPSVRSAGAEANGGRLAYVSNLMSHTVSVIDLDARRWIRDLELGRYPVYSSLDPHDPTKMILALHNYERTESDDAIVLVDLTSGKLLKTVPFPGPGMPSGFVYDAKRDRIYVADENLHRIFALDGTTLEPIFDLPAGLIPIHVDVSPDGRWLVATNRKSANLYVYDLDNALHSAKDGIYTIPLGPAPGLHWDADTPDAEPSSHPLDVKFSGDNRTVWVTDSGSMQLLAVDIVERKVTGRIVLDLPPFDMALNRDRSLAFVCHVSGDAITVVDLKKRTVASVIDGLTPNPIHCALDEDRGLLLAAGWGADRAGGVHLIDLKTLEAPRDDPARRGQRVDRNNDRGVRAGYRVSARSLAIRSWIGGCDERKVSSV